MQFGDVLRKCRKLKGYTQEQMAEKMFMSQANISRIENDEMDLRAVDLIRWAQITDMPQVAAAMICGVDPSTLAKFMDSVMSFAQLIGAFIFPLIGGDIYYEVGQNQ